MDKKEKLQAVFTKGKELLIKKKIFVLLFGLIIIAFYSSTRIPIDTVAFECVSERGSYYSRTNPRRYIFQKFIINKNNNPNEFFPVNFFNYALMSEYSKHNKMDIDCSFGLGLIRCTSYIGKIYRKILNEENDINIKKTQEIRNITITQVKFDEYDATIDNYPEKFDKDEKIFKTNYKTSFHGFCKQTVIKF